MLLRFSCFSNEILRCTNFTVRTCVLCSDSIYARMDNPTRLLLERTVFELECANILSDTNGNANEATTNNTPTCFAFSSGMQAVTAILLAHSSSAPGKMTVLIPADVYHGVRSLLSDVFSRHGVQVRELNMASVDGNVDGNVDGKWQWRR